MKSLSLYIASRYTLATGKSHLLAFISRVSIIGLVLAVSILITVLSVMNGFDNALRDRILALIPHASLASYGPIENWQAMVQVAQEFPGVAHAEPFVFLPVLTVHGKTVSSALLYGIDGDYQADSSILKQLLGDDLLRQLHVPKTLVMGKSLADNLALEIGDSVRVIVPAKQQQEMPAVDYFTLIGVLHSGTELDQKLLLSHRQSVALLANRSIDSVDGIRLQVDDLFKARDIAYQLAAVIDLHRVQDWSRTHGNLYQAIQVSRKMVVLLVLIIIAVAAFNVISTLVLAVNDKARDIAILRTMGAGNRQILSVFVWQGLIIGLLGVGMGVLLGVLFSLFIGDILAVIESITHSQLLSSNIYPVDHLPSDVQWQDIAMVSVLALSLSVLASLFPAWQAMRMQPAKILRHD